MREHKKNKHREDMMRNELKKQKIMKQTARSRNTQMITDNFVFVCQM